MDFLQKLQSAPEATKRRWTIIVTVIVMVIVIYVWLAYFNNLVKNFSATGQPPVASIGPTSSGSNEASFWETFKSGVANLLGAFTGKLNALGNILNAPREYIIKPPQ
jgi:hypothetical protein